MQAKAAASAFAPALDKVRQEHDLAEVRLRSAHKRKLEEMELKDKTEMVSNNTYQKEVRALTFVRLHVIVVQQLVGAHHNLGVAVLAASIVGVPVHSAAGWERSGRLGIAEGRLNHHYLRLPGRQACGL